CAAPRADPFDLG
ncbi:hypothetical protein A2U01_0097600, partial [Trifolium medium]|nr:hypothetical protein [Trifolium medium]